MAASYRKFRYVPSGRKVMVWQPPRVPAGAQSPRYVLAVATHLPSAVNTEFVVPVVEVDGVEGAGAEGVCTTHPAAANAITTAERKDVIRGALTHPATFAAIIMKQL